MFPNNPHFENIGIEKKKETVCVVYLYARKSFL